MCNDQHMTHAVGDITLIFKHVNEKHVERSGKYVGDSILAVTQAFRNTTDLTFEQFDSEQRSLENFNLLRWKHLRLINDSICTNRTTLANCHRSPRTVLLQFSNLMSCLWARYLTHIWKTLVKLLNCHKLQRAPLAPYNCRI